MASEIIVNTIKAPTTGANANKVIIPSGVTLDASAGTLRPSAGAVVQVTQSNPVGGSNLAVGFSHSGNNKANYVPIGSTYNLSITTKYANSWIVVEGCIQLVASAKSHAYFDMKVFTNGSDGGSAKWLSEITK